MKVTKRVKVEEEHDPRIKIEPKGEIESHMSPVPIRRPCELSGDSIKSWGSETDHTNQSFSQEEGPKWPQDYYVCDIVAVFKRPPRGISKKTTFERHFPGLEFKKSTFYDNYNLWKRTPIALRSHYVDYGRTAKGSWKKFMTARATS